MASRYPNPKAIKRKTAANHSSSAASMACTRRTATRSLGCCASKPRVRHASPAWGLRATCWYGRGARATLPQPCAEHAGGVHER